MIEVSSGMFGWQFRVDVGSPWNGGGGYYGGPVYDGYGYALPPHHDPSLYAAAAYGAYPMYGGHQQQVSWMKEEDHLSTESGFNGQKFTLCNSAWSVQFLRIHPNCGVDLSFDNLR